MNILKRRNSSLLAVMVLSLCACATSSTTKIFEDRQLGKTPYSNFLVVGIAGDYNARAQFEREVVRRLDSLGIGAAAFHAVIGGETLVNRDTVRQALSGRNFDAVIVTHVLDEQSRDQLVDSMTDTKVTRKEGNPLNLFRYDYQDLEHPPSLKINTSVSIQTDLYDAANENLVWSIETNSGTFDNAGQLIDSLADAVVSRLKNDRLLAR